MLGAVGGCVGMKCLSLLAGALLMSHSGLYGEGVGAMHEAELKQIAQQGAVAIPRLQQNKPPVIDNLLDALKYHDLQAARRLLDQGASANEVVRQDGSTVLHMAALYGYLDFVHLLLGRAAIVEQENGYQEQPLHYAAIGGSAEVASTLLAFGAPVDARDMWDKTPLHKAAWRGQVEVMKILLRGGADVNAAYIFQHTPLHEAARKGHLEAVRVLIEAGADPDLKTRRGDTALEMALETQHRHQPNDKIFEALETVIQYLRSL